jgi:single-strand DNA-binding protein
MNKVMILGRLGADPELKKVGENSVTNFSLATNESWTNKQGEKQERTEWHRVVVWGKLAELCKEYLHKGRQALVEGKIQTRKWQNKEGKDQYTTEIVASNVQFIGDKQTGQTQDSAPAYTEEDVPL